MVTDGFDFSPLFHSTIGFDRLFRLLDAASRVDGASPGYPPYNYRLTMAVAGFSPSELDVHEVPEAAKPREIAIGTSPESVQPQVTLTEKSATRRR